jgi:hypothetical protein
MLKFILTIASMALLLVAGTQLEKFYFTEKDPKDQDECKYSRKAIEVVKTESCDERECTIIVRDSTGNEERLKANPNVRVGDKGEICHYLELVGGNSNVRKYSSLYISEK